MPRNAGYLLPENIEPDDDWCFVVHCPKDEGYRRALFGAIERLGYWWAWERDPLKQGKDAANRWRESMSLTWETYETIGDICDMNITVNCGSGSGACCDQRLVFIVDGDLHLAEPVYEGILELPGGAQDDGENPPTSDWAQYSAYQQYKCDKASLYALNLENTLDNLAGWMSGLTGLGMLVIRKILNSGLISNLVEGLLGVLFFQEGAIERMIASILNIGEDDTANYGDFADVVAQMDFDEVVCTLYNSETATDCVDNVRALWRDALTAAGVGSPSTFSIQRWEFESIFNYMSRREVFESFFDYVADGEPSLNYDCSSCGGVTPPASSTITNDLMHWWRMEEASSTRADAHGTLDLAVNGTAVGQQSPGIDGDAADFDGTGALHEQSHQLLTSGDSFTFAAWVKTDSPSNRAIAGWRDAQGTWSRSNWDLFFTGATTLSFRIMNTSNTVETISATWPDNTNPHLLIVEYDYDNDTFAMYIDDPSSADASDTLANKMAYRQEGFVVGGLANLTTGVAYIMDGWMDEVSVWSRLLTAEEKSYLYNSGAGVGYPGA